MIHHTRSSILGILPFAVTIFTAAFLLFQVQPLITKYILPWFGGGPAVWTTCVLFFQVFLLAGYGYAHLSILRFKPGIQVLVHTALLLIALLQLPIMPTNDWKPPSPDAPTLDILLLLVATLGFPYFVLSSTTPLMQAWFVQTRPGILPYRLYALSNAGSFLALLSYPFVVEPMFSRGAQSIFWTIGFGVFTAATFVCIWAVWTHGRTDPASTDSTDKPDTVPPHPNVATRILWLALPACAAVLLLAVTNQITMDAVVVPFLWVLPLCIYLLTFILCFESERWYSRPIFMIALLPVLMASLVTLYFGEEVHVILQISVFCTSLFVCCMICHGELSLLKPHPRYLTGYYLMIALGGALGGAFVTLVAPLIFLDYLELHVGLMGAAALCLIALYGDKNSWFHRRRVAWAVPLITVFVVFVTLFMAQARESRQSSIVRTRNFYGVLSVQQFFRGSLDEQRHLLHGRISHGIQYTAPSRKGLATGFYAPSSGVGLVFRHFPRKEGRRIGLVGLGAGTLALYAGEYDTMRIYEINPEIRRLAESYFTYLKDSPANIEIVMGDARLAMERDPPQEFDILLLDAFSGDAIPVHLLTVEAFETYLRHLKSDGVIVILIETYHLNFEPVLRRLASQLGLRSIRINSNPENDMDWGSSWMILTRNEEFLNIPPIVGAATKDPAPWYHVRLWTDDYTSLLSLLEFNGWRDPKVAMASGNNRPHELEE